MLEQVHKVFIDRFILTNSPEQAAIDSGINRRDALTAGIEFLKNPEVREAIEKRKEDFREAYSTIKIDKETLVRMLMFQYESANKQGKSKEATDILCRIGEINGVSLNDIKADPIQLIINNLDKDKI